MNIPQKLTDNKHSNHDSEAVITAAYLVFVRLPWYSGDLSSSLTVTLDLHVRIDEF